MLRHDEAKDREGRTRRRLFRRGRRLTSAPEAFKNGNLRPRHFRQASSSIRLRRQDEAIWLASGDRRWQIAGGGDRWKLGEDFLSLQVVLDCTDARALAEFYRRLLGLQYRPGAEPPTAGEPDPSGHDWLVLRDSTGTKRLAFQEVANLSEVTWPEGPIPQQLHLDLTVPTVQDLDTQHERASAFGARLLRDRSDDPEEPLRVYADPAGHPFCIFVVNSVAT